LGYSRGTLGALGAAVVQVLDLEPNNFAAQLHVALQVAS
jgi:hypothetical protein